MAITRISGNQIATSTQAILTTLSFLNTNSIFKLPVGDTASRPTGVSPGTLRFNSQEDSAEIYKADDGTGSAGWTEVAGGGPSLGNDAIIRTNGVELTETVTVGPTANNDEKFTHGFHFGTLTLGASANLTIESGAGLQIVATDKLLAYQSDIDNLRDHLFKFGFGRNICADCFLPDTGLLPSPEWKMNTHNFGWFKGDTVNMGVGQGYLSATPIQLAYYAAMLANKGKVNKFSFVPDFYRSEKDIFNLENVDEVDWNKMHLSMIGVIDNPKGTAGRLRALKDYKIAAKSGTVELVSTDTKEDYKIIRETEGNRDHAIIIAFGPMPNPKYAVSVVIENGESGGSVAGPVAIAVMNALIEND